MIGWVFFRARDLGAALDVLWLMLPTQGFSTTLLESGNQKMAFAGVVVGMGIALALKNTWEIRQDCNPVKTAAFAALLIACLTFLFGAVSHPFLYFQF